MKTEVWRIFVPAEDDLGDEYPVEYHEVWDVFVRRVTGGVTIMKSAKGQWVSPTGKLYAEKTIPCEIMCNREQMQEIIDFTIVYYAQEAVLAYKVSDEVIMYSNNVKFKKDNFLKILYKKVFKK